ncbi:MAG: cellulose synthase operon protein YhjQ/BcsQ, partial [Planctomycetota bacterium]
LATTQLNRFALPGVARHLVDNYAEVFAATVEGVSKRWPVLGLVGCRPGSGATTTTLALAWLLAGEGAPVAVIDADPFGSDLAAGLGIARQKTIAETLAAGAALPDAALHAVDDGVSVLVAGELTQHRAVVREAVHQLRQSHAAVLIDLGPDPRRITMHADAVVLVHPQEESDAVVEYSCRSLCQSGAAVVGTIQTMAPAD